jgi:hypothetical protein
MVVVRFKHGDILADTCEELRVGTYPVHAAISRIFIVSSSLSSSLMQ